MSEIDTDCTDEVVCPWCGYEYDTSYELFTGHKSMTETECEKCGNSFVASCELKTTYSTRKAVEG